MESSHAQSPRSAFVGACCKPFLQSCYLAFVHNPLLDAGGDIGVGAHGASPGVRIAYISDVNGGNNITASLGVFGTSNGISAGADYLDTFTKPLTIAQLEYAGNGGVVQSGSEKIYELFYAWQANDSLQITPSLQFIDNPAGNADDLKVWGLRAKLAY